MGLKRDTASKLGPMVLTTKGTGGTTISVDWESYDTQKGTYTRATGKQAKPAGTVSTLHSRVLNILETGKTTNRTAWELKYGRRAPDTKEISSPA